MQITRQPRVRSLKQIATPKYRKPKRKRVLRADAPDRIESLTRLIKSNQKLLRHLNYGKNPELREVAFFEQKIAGLQKERKLLKTDTGRAKFIYLDGGAK